MGQKHRNFVLHRFLDIYKNYGGKIVRGGAFIEQDVSDIARSGDGCLAQCPEVVGVVWTGNRDL